MNTATPSDATSLIASALQMLVDGVRTEGRNYLIVSSGHAYLQFSPDWGEGSMLA
jgi:transketolase N-terminal domain/subunit